MSYIMRKGNGLMGFGESPTCGPGTGLDPSGTKCVAYAGGTSTPPAGGSSSSSSSWLDKLLAGAADVLKAKYTPAPVTNINTTGGGGGGGIGTMGKVAIAGAAGLGLILILRSRK